MAFVRVSRIPKPIGMDMRVYDMYIGPKLVGLNGQV